MITMFRPTKKNRGFTLVELAIVLAVTGVLFLGLYRLLSGGNQQLKDSSVASQQIQLINSVKQYLSSSEGGLFMGEYTTVGASQNITTLVLPSAANAPDGTSNTLCKGGYGDAHLKPFCDALPAGFSGSTINAYGQTFLIRVQVPSVTVAGTPPSTYAFMIATTAGDTIPDADGGRISSQIGSDGGFIYATAGTCGKQACGSYGAWAADVSGAVPAFGFPAAPVGHVVSRTYSSPELNGGIPWLARKLCCGDTAATASTAPTYNTMTTDLFLGGKNMYLATGTDTATAGTAGAAGTINLQGGGIADSESNGNALKIFPTGPTYNDPTTGLVTKYLSSANSGNTILRVNTNCSIDTAAQTYGLHYTNGDSPTNASNDCPSAIAVRGDENVTGTLQATSLFAGTFLYQSSDMRLKKDILPLQHPLDDVMQMKPVSFVFKAGGQKSLGFIAQDIEKLYPQLVTPQKGESMKSVNYDGLIAPLAGAIQELKKQNDDLRQQLAEQKQRQDQLEQQLKSKVK